MTSGLGILGRLRRFGDSPELLAIRRALPLSFAGLVAGLGLFFAIGHGALGERFLNAFIEGFSVMAITLVVLLAGDLARRRSVSPIAAIVISLCAFALSLPYRSNAGFEKLAYRVGPSGLILGMIVSLVSVGALVFFGRKLGRIASIAAAFVAVVGVAAAIAGAGISLAELLTQAMEPLGRLGDTFPALLIITAVEVLLWAVGIHGPALLAAIVLPVYLQLQNENTQALAHGQPLPHIVVVSTFLFIFPGGCGATLPLVLLLLRSRVARVRSVALASLAPAIFNVNEPLMFGLPVVFNPVLAVPYVLSPLVLATVTYVAMAAGLVARPAFYMPSTVPQPLGAFLATKDWRAVVLMLVNIVLSAAIYWPFIGRYERAELERAAAA